MYRLKFQKEALDRDTDFFCGKKSDVRLQVKNGRRKHNRLNTEKKGYSGLEQLMQYQNTA